MSMARTPPPEDAGVTGAGAAGPPTNPRGQNPAGPFVDRQRGEDVRAALENAERLVDQTTTRLAAEEARATGSGSKHSTRTADQ